MTTCAPTTLDEALAGAVLDLLPDALVVERLTRTPDSSGGTTEAYAQVQADVPCRVRPTGGGELILADRMGLADAYTIMVPYGTDIQAPDEVLALGLRFHVQFVPQADSAGLVTRLIATVVA